MALRKFLFLDSANDGNDVEANPTADSAQIGQLILSGIAGTGGLVGLNLSNTLISNVATPVSTTDAATKAYVDASGAGVTVVELNCGNIPVNEYTALVTDSRVTTSSKIIYSLSGQTPTGKDADEITMDDLFIVPQPLAGQISFYMKGMEGQIHGAFRIAYLVGA